MKTLLIENQTLKFIIQQIIEGGFGVDSNDFLITNTVNEKYREIAIKSCSINIIDTVVESIGDLNLKVDGFEDEIFEFICYKSNEEIDEETNQKQNICFCMTLFELSFIYDDILDSTGWNCFSLSNY